jgi:uncharacterized delta-60 repeat protein
MALKRSLLAGLVALLLGSPVARAALPAPGTTDRGFGLNGTASLSDPFLDFTPGFLAVQPDGRVLLGASANVPGSSAGPGAVVSRFSAAGTLDRSYGSGGRVETGLLATAARQDLAPAFAPDAEGGFAAAQVSSTDSGPVLTVMRYDHDGQPLASFAGGRADISIDPYISGVGAVSVLPDGSVIALLLDHGAIYRFTPAGVLDSTFGGGTGHVTVANPPEYLEQGSMVVRPDGRILVGGQLNSSTRGNPDSLLAQLLPDGRLDQTFGGASTGYLIDRSLLHTGITALALRPDGRVLAARRSCTRIYPSNCRALLWQLPPDGGTEANRTETALKPLATVVGLALDRRGGVVVLGWSGEPENSLSYLLRRRADGSADRGFPARWWADREATIGPALTTEGRIVVAWRASRYADTAIAHLTRFWGGYDRRPPVIRVKLSCAEGHPTATVSVRDRSRLARVRVFLGRRKLRSSRRSRFELDLKPGRMSIQAVDVAGNAAHRVVRVRRCVSG